MKQIRRLQTVSVLRQTRTKRADGTIAESYTLTEQYRVIAQELTDEVSVATYGANVNKMMRLSSPHETLSKWLKTKNNDSADNVSKYRIELNGERYKIVAVKENWVDIEHE